VDVQTATISKSGNACSAGMWEIEAKPRLGLAPTMPTRILLAMATVSFRSQFIVARTLSRSQGFGKPQNISCHCEAHSDHTTFRFHHVARQIALLGS
jgi:hypothetical protein